MQTLLLLSLSNIFMMIALTVFLVLMITVLGEALHWRHIAALGCIMAAVGFMFVGR